MTTTQVLRRTLFYLLALALVLVFIAPTLFMVSTSFQSTQDVYKLPPKWWPRNPTLSAYEYLFTNFPTVSWALNTTFYTVVTLVLQLVVCSLAAYAFSAIKFVAKNFLFLLILATLMVPFEVRMIALYLVNYRLGLVDSMWGVILPNIASPFSLFLFVQFFRQIPRELEESARMDGCNRFQIFRSVVLPLSVNTVLILAILIAIFCWNDFFWPLINLNTVTKQVLSVGIFNLLSSNLMQTVGYPLAMAGCLFMAVPLIVLYVVFQRYIINAYLYSGIKG